ncbi:hypothetical protein VTK73DRAFT_9752 [Phialemonium thermophilum]|uniref:Secreted protein n=1 Tax=Phialemonium thermophilum TaxID=223376 RepID=A0ABR3W0M7_9PEZI
MQNTLVLDRWSQAWFCVSSAISLPPSSLLTHRFRSGWSAILLTQWARSEWACHSTRTASLGSACRDAETKDAANPWRHPEECSLALVLARFSPGRRNKKHMRETRTRVASSRGTCRPWPGNRAVLDRIFGSTRLVRLIEVIHLVCAHYEDVGETGRCRLYLMTYGG